MKAVLIGALMQAGLDVPVLAGVHDTDYFSKLPGRSGAGGGPDTSSASYAMVPRNDGYSRELWAAIGEISALFGSETPVTLHQLRAHNVPVDRLIRTSPIDKEAFVNRTTEAWGWRGLVRLEPGEVIGRDVKVEEVAPALQECVAWALDESTKLLPQEEARQHARQFSSDLLHLIASAVQQCRGRSLTQMLKILLREMFRQRLGRIPDFVEFGATSEFFRFNRQTASRPLFDLVDLFLIPATGPRCKAAYDAAVQHTGMYRLEEFGEGALPFDLVVPGRARGTLRITPLQVIADLPEGPVFVCWSAAVNNRADLAVAIERRFGPDCSLVGKAIVLPVMCLSEVVMVLNEGGSVYVAGSTKAFVRQLVNFGVPLRLFPILRLHYSALDAIGVTGCLLNLPPHLARAFGRDTLSAQEFSNRWRDVVAQQEKVLEEARCRPGTPAIMEYLCDTDPESWNRLCEARTQLLQQIRAEAQSLVKLHHELGRITAECHAAGRRLEEVQRQSGNIRRSRLKPLWDRLAELPTDAAERDPLIQELERAEAERTKLRQEIGELIEKRACCMIKWREIRHTIQERNRKPPLATLRQNLAQIESEVESARLGLVSDALRTIALEKVDHRPSSWWFSFLPRGDEWFASVAAGTQAYFEELAPGIAPPCWGLGQVALTQAGQNDE